MKNPLFDLDAMMSLAAVRGSKVVAFARWREIRRGGRTQKKRKHRYRKRQACCAVLATSPASAQSQTDAEKNAGLAVPMGAAEDVYVRSFFAGLAPDPDFGVTP